MYHKSSPKTRQTNIKDKADTRLLTQANSIVANINSIVANQITNSRQTLVHMEVRVVVHGIVL